MAQIDKAPLLVVGLGASAGGVQALSTFFTSVPAGEPIAYVVVLHLSPEHESHLARILQTRTPLPVIQVQGDTRIEAGHVYVIAPRGTLSVRDGQLLVTPAAGVADRRAPIDILFRTMAEHYAADAVAVVLSGTGADGSTGIKRVKEYGGLTIAQSPSEAEYPDMPEHAIATRLVDFILPAAEIAPRIVEYAHHVRRAHREADPSASVVEVDPLREIMRLLQLRTGQDFSNYKPATIRRRVARRLGIRGLRTVGEYVELLRESPEEATALMKELLISVTGFFRDPDGFALLAREVVPRLFTGKRSADQVRVWSAGCATGEEAYSLAMLLVEHASTLPEPPAIQVFASDLDEEAIALAREGLYTDADVADLAPERLRRFFTRETDGYRVRRELRELLLFAHHNVIKDPPFSHLDLIACRNLLIYLNRAAQERLIATFHFALRPGGTLFLGASETPDVSAHLFVPVDKNAHIYESRSVASRLPVPLVDRPLPSTAALPRTLEARGLDRISPGELHLRLLEQFAPPSVVVTDEHTVVHISEHAGTFLNTPGGEPSRDVMKLVHPDLRADLRHALHLATQNREAVDVSRARMHTAGGTMLVNLSVKPVLRDDTPPRGYFVITFQDAGAAPAAEATTLASLGTSGAARADDELMRVRDQLRSTIEQYETQVEESKASNEALQAMNEELRSAAEELETSKEELQSVNEELTTVNEELKIKVDELGLTNNDFQNLISSTDIGAIFLDKGMRVKLTTPRAQNLFNLLPGDIGRPLSDITSRVTYPELQADIARVLDTLQTTEREVPTQDGRWYFLRLVPYRTLDDRIEGVALAFQDVTTRHAEQERWRASEERLRAELEDRVRQRTTELQQEIARRTEAQERASALLRRVVTTQEDERARIARELHDQLGQQLTALRLALERHDARCTAPGELAPARAAARELDAAVDYLAWELRPAVLDQIGLASALPRFVEQWSSHCGIVAKAEVSAAAAAALSAEAQVAFYRVAQESLTNVAKHAHAARVDLVLDGRDSSVVMVIEDNGIGFDPADRDVADRGVGIAGMRERAALVGATLDIESAPGKGTSVYLRCPVAATAGSAA